MRIYIILFLAFATSVVAQGPNSIGRNLVRVLTTSQTPDYTLPWNPGPASEGVGAGFVVEGNMIMTNAHVVSNARFIVLTREADPREYQASVKYIAHDCDLALLEVSDDSFFNNTTPLAFGGIPELESTVSAYGYPLGGARASVTRGVVSRIDFLPYSHSMVDSHLAIQIDAAINPGNSGGPVMQDGEVVGVAFQGFSGAVAQNVGYMIPTPVIRRFLHDIKDGSYDRYVDLAITYSKLQNPAQRAALGLKNDFRGVMVNSVYADGSSHGVLQKGDVLLAIDGMAVSQDGFVELDGSRVEMPEVIERKLKNESVTFDILRAGKSMQLSTELRPAWQFAIQAAQYNVRPRFVLFGGLLFQPLGKEVMEAYQINDLRIRYYYDFFVTDEIYVDRPEIILLSQILPDPVNTYLAGFRNTIVEEINGIKIRTLEDVSRAFKLPVKTHVIKPEGFVRPIVLEAAEVAASRERILSRYNVLQEENLSEQWK